MVAFAGIAAENARFTAQVAVDHLLPVRREVREILSDFAVTVAIVIPPQLMQQRPQQIPQPKRRAAPRQQNNRT